MKLWYKNLLYVETGLQQTNKQTDDNNNNNKTKVGSQLW